MFYAMIEPIGDIDNRTHRMVVFPNVEAWRRHKDREGRSIGEKFVRFESIHGMIPEPVTAGRIGVTPQDLRTK